MQLTINMNKINVNAKYFFDFVFPSICTNIENSLNIKSPGGTFYYIDWLTFNLLKGGQGK